MKKVITVRNVTKIENGRKVLDDISFDAYEGDIVGLIGGGKEALIKILSGLSEFDIGQIYYNNYSLTNDYEKAMSIVSTVVEKDSTYKNINCQNNLEIFKMMFKGIDENTIKEIVKIIQMEKLLGRKFKTFSLGMEERLNIASSLICKPKILILDKPFDNLNIDELKRVIKTIKSLKDLTIVISSNLLNVLDKVCNKLIFIDDGKIVNIKVKESKQKKLVNFEVDDFSKARLLIKDYCVNEDLCVYETDEKISLINKELLSNNINVYRIYDNVYNLEKEFIDISKY